MSVTRARMSWLFLLNMLSISKLCGIIQLVKSIEVNDRLVFTCLKDGRGVPNEKDETIVLFSRFRIVNDDAAVRDERFCRWSRAKRKCYTICGVIQPK